ncbi:MAG: DUF4468 domain-containing protein [Galbibacter orientalis]|uniref:DUF4468 domain-containing protein n=1 Tax=Galbibacter orientalis TaxID=453852 RepID=UPI0030033B3A
MKKILLLLIFPLLSNSQVVVDSVNKTIYLNEVHEINLSKSSLKDKADRWVAKAFNNSNQVTRINNDDNILAKGSFEVGADYGLVYSKRKLEYTLDLQFKEGRFKIEINNLILSGSMVSNELSLYFMSFSEYDTFFRKSLEVYDESMRKKILKRINKNGGVEKNFEVAHNFGTEITSQIVQELERINSSLLSYMKSEEDKDEW